MIFFVDEKICINFVFHHKKLEIPIYNNMTALGLLKFESYNKPVLWGGTRISELKGIAPYEEPIGESWEISGLEGNETCVAEGEYKGIGINKMLELRGEEILGRRLYKRYGNKFPILVKWLDAEKDLSIQVHPDDRMAYDKHDGCGKTELWYVLDPLPNAYIYSGLTARISPIQLQEHIANNTLPDVLAKFYPQRGDLFYIPAGRIHSLGAGNLVLEIQQTSDITYRVYDYDRIDMNGNKRTLHIEDAMDATDFRVHEDYMYHVEPMVNAEKVLKECPYFTTTLISLTSPMRLPIARYDSFRIVVATRGRGVLKDDRGCSCEITQGYTLLVPASTKWVEIIPEGELELVTTYIQ